MNYKQCEKGHFYDPSADSTCPICRLENFQKFWRRDYAENQCGNCRAYLKDGDLYCRKCGTKRGEGKFAPYFSPEDNIMQCIYGPPPVKRKHICPECGYSWETTLMIDEEYYCPKCGAVAKYEESSNEETVGLLVCIDGHDKGKTYNIHAGYNYIGSTPNMDIFIEDDPSIRRSDNCMIAYDVIDGTFFAGPVREPIVRSSNIQLNGEPLLEPVELKAHDCIGIGSTLLEFILLN